MALHYPILSIGPRFCPLSSCLPWTLKLDYPSLKHRLISKQAFCGEYCLCNFNTPCSVLGSNLISPGSLGPNEGEAIAEGCPSMVQIFRWGKCQAYWQREKKKAWLEDSKPWFAKKKSSAQKRIDDWQWKLHIIGHYTGIQTRCFRGQLLCWIVPTSQPGGELATNDI